MTRQRIAKATSATSPARQDEVADSNPLKRLILTRMDQLKLTYVEVATRGGFPSHSTVHALVKKEKHRQAPRPETLLRLAKALEVPLDVVSVAAARSAGLRFEQTDAALDADADISSVVQAMRAMPPADRHAYARVGMALAARPLSATTRE